MALTKPVYNSVPLNGFDWVRSPDVLIADIKAHIERANIWTNPTDIKVYFDIDHYGSGSNDSYMGYDCDIELRLCIEAQVPMTAAEQKQEEKRLAQLKVTELKAKEAQTKAQLKSIEQEKKKLLQLAKKYPELLK